MALPSYELQIITPQGITYTNQVTHTRVPVKDGSVGVLAHHANYVTSTPGGRLEITEAGGKEKIYYVGTGFFEVNHDHATFLTQSFRTEEKETVSA